MARNLFSYEVTLTPNANPDTMVAIVAPTDQNVVLTVVEFFPEGVTAAAVPLEFVLQKADNTTNLTDDSSRIRKVNQFSGPTVQTKLWKKNSGQNGFTETEYEARTNVHQQVPGEMKPKNGYGEFIIPAGETWAIRSVGVQSIPVTVRLNLEE